MSKEWWSAPGEAWPWSYFAFGRRARFFESGEVRLAILSLLSEGPKHGYQLMKELEERSGGLYRASAGSVYPTLQQLEDEGLIEADQLEGKRVFRLTETGRKEVERDPESVRRIWERAERWQEWSQFGNPQKMAVFQPLVALIKACWQASARLPADTGSERIREVLERTRRELDQL